MRYKQTKAELLEYLSKEKQMSQAEAEKVQQLVIEAQRGRKRPEVGRILYETSTKRNQKLPNTSVQNKRNIRDFDVIDPKTGRLNYIKWVLLLVTLIFSLHRKSGFAPSKRKRYAK